MGKGTHQLCQQWTTVPQCKQELNIVFYATVGGNRKPQIGYRQMYLDDKKMGNGPPLHKHGIRKVENAALQNDKLEIQILGGIRGGSRHSFCSHARYSCGANCQCALPGVLVTKRSAERNIPPLDAHCAD